MKVTSKCHSCGKNYTVEVPDKGYEEWLGGKAIQFAMPKVHPLVRDCLISNMCLDCLSSMYNTPKPGEDWGEQKGNCECCDAPLWGKDYNAYEGVYVCPTCHTEQKLGGD